MMLIIHEIGKLELTLLQKSGLREKLFYWFLTKSGNYDVGTAPIAELDKICYAAFIDNKIDVSKEISRNLNAAPVKGIHFSSNFILQVAFALISGKVKQEYLVGYYQSLTLKEQFLLNIVFSDFKFPSNLNRQDDLERLIFEVFIEKNYISAEKLLLPALRLIGDLTDLYVFTKAYEELLLLHPSNLIIESYKKIDNEVKNIISVVKKRVNVFVNTSFILIGLGMVVLLPYFIIKKWTSWNLEPIITGLLIAYPIIGAVVYALYRVKQIGRAHV